MSFDDLQCTLTGAAMKVPFTLGTVGHFGLAARDPRRSAQWFMRVLGLRKEFEFEDGVAVGNEQRDRRVSKAPHRKQSATCRFIFRPSMADGLPKKHVVRTHGPLALSPHRDTLSRHC